MPAMTGKGRQITNAAVYMLPLLVGNLVPLVTLPIFTRILSKEDYGAFALANAYAVVVAGVATAGLPVTYDRNFFEYRGQRAQLLYSVVAFSALAFALCGLVTWFLRGPISAAVIGDARYQQVVVWSFWTTAVVGLKAYYMTYLRNSERAGAYSSYTIGERLLAGVVTLVLVAWVRAGVIGLVLGQFLASLAVLLVIAARASRELPVAFAARPLADSLKLGCPLIPRTLLGVVGNNFDKYLIGQIASLGGVGIYSIAQRVAGIAFSYMTALQNVFGPQVYSRMFAGGPSAGRSVGRYLTPFAYASTVLAFLIAVFSEEILTVLTPAQYHGAIPLVTILAAYQGILFFGKIPQVMFARKTHLVTLLAVFGTLVSVACGAAGIWLWGTDGAAWGAFAAGAVITTVGLIVGQRCFRVEWETRRLFAIFGLFLGSAFLVVAMRGMGAPYLLRAGAKLACLAGFVWLGVRLQIISADHLGLVRDLVLRRRGRSQAGVEAL